MTKLDVYRAVLYRAEYNIIANMRSHMSKTLWDEDRLSDPHGQPDKAARVQAMFDAIAPTYERVNRILSAGQDRRWRRRAVRLAETNANDRVLDMACGTGDFARAFVDVEPAEVVGCDFSAEMLRLASSRSGGPIDWCRADALALPFADESFSLASCAFGVRNFQDLATGLREMYRVLMPGGRAVILEFSTPRSRLLGRLYLLYFRHILPRVASLLSSDRTGAYAYLPKSVSSFADADGMSDALRLSGFAHVEHHTLTIGIVTVYIAWKT